MLSITALETGKEILPFNPRWSQRKYRCLLQKGTALTIIARVENTDRRKPTLSTEKGLTAIMHKQAKPSELIESARLSVSRPVSNNKSITPALTTDALKDARNIINNMNALIKLI